MNNIKTSNKDHLEWKRKDLQEEMKRALESSKAAHQNALERVQSEFEKQIADVEKQLSAIDSGLELKWQEAVTAANSAIQVHLNDAYKSLEAAIAVSETTGVPFTSILSPFAKRLYMPRSFSVKWPDVSRYDVIEDLGRYDCGDEIGWEYWSSSSMTC